MYHWYHYFHHHDHYTHCHPPHHHQAPVSVQLAVSAIHNSVRGKNRLHPVMPPTDFVMIHINSAKNGLSFSIALWLFIICVPSVTYSWGIILGHLSSDTYSHIKFSILSWNLVFLLGTGLLAGSRTQSQPSFGEGKESLDGMYTWLGGSWSMRGGKSICNQT